VSDTTTSRLTWLGHATFRIETSEGKVLYIDPWLKENPACPDAEKEAPAMDAILLTHAHFDHIGDTVELARKYQPQVIANHETSMWLASQGVENAVGMNKGGTVDVAGCRATMVSADHSCGLQDGEQLLYGGEASGFVLTLPDGFRVYHAGDTNVFGDMSISACAEAPRHPQGDPHPLRDIPDPHRDARGIAGTLRAAGGGGAGPGAWRILGWGRKLTVSASRLLEELDRVLCRRIDSQRDKVLEVAHRVEPKVTRDDLNNPEDYPALRRSETFQYEDGILAGLLTARTLLHRRGRELGLGSDPVPAAPADVVDPFDHDTGAVPYRFCPRCGGRLELRLLVAHDPERLTCAECAFVFYLDPKVAAGAILKLDGGIVLGRRAIPPRVGAWGFPSGYVDRGERIEDAAAREVREEVGLESSMDRLVGVYSYSGRPVVVVVFSGRITGGELQALHETQEVGTFAPDRIPWDDLAFSSTRDALEEYVRRGAAESK
jgi:ADP-ribose pyrophosphatase YjhB (NUDIX family)